MNDSGLGDGLGYMVGLLLLVVAPVVFLAVNVLALKRHTTNRRCVISIILAFTAWLIALAGSAAIQSAGSISTVRLIPFAVCLGITLASATFAIIGIVECIRHHRYRRGRRRAIVALMLDLLFLAAAAYAVFSGLLRHGLPSGTTFRFTA